MAHWNSSSNWERFENIQWTFSTSSCVISERHSGFASLSSFRPRHGWGHSRPDHSGQDTEYRRRSPDPTGTDTEEVPV